MSTYPRHIYHSWPRIGSIIVYYLLKTHLSDRSQQANLVLRLAPEANAFSSSCTDSRVPWPSLGDGHPHLQPPSPHSLSTTPFLTSRPTSPLSPLSIPDMNPFPSGPPSSHFPSPGSTGSSFETLPLPFVDQSNFSQEPQTSPSQNSASPSLYTHAGLGQHSTEYIPTPPSLPEAPRSAGSSSGTTTMIGPPFPLQQYDQMYPYAYRRPAAISVPSLQRPIDSPFNAGPLSSEPLSRSFGDRIPYPPSTFASPHSPRPPPLVNQFAGYNIPGPLVPQVHYKPQSQSDQRRYVDEAKLSEPIPFMLMSPESLGVPLRDALSSHLQRLKDKDTTLFHGAGPSVSIRICVSVSRLLAESVTNRQFSGKDISPGVSKFPPATSRQSRVQSPKQSWPGRLRKSLTNSSRYYSNIFNMKSIFSLVFLSLRT